MLTALTGDHDCVYGTRLYSRKMVFFLTGTRPGGGTSGGGRQLATAVAHQG